MTEPLVAAREVMRAGQWSGAVRDVVRLDYDQRHRRRIAMTGENGTAFLLDLAEPIVLRHGDGLKLADGGVIEVAAAAEHLTEITALSTDALMRIAWHLGNRHTPTQLDGHRLLIRHDHVLEAMVEGLGGMVRTVDEAFDPEGGAYSGDHGGHHHHD